MDPGSPDAPFLQRPPVPFDELEWELIAVPHQHEAFSASGRDRPASDPRAMVIRPSKEQVRTFLEQRRRTPAPPPSIAEIRRQLGWYMAHARRLPAR